MKTLTRRQIRYICFRIQTEQSGGAKMGALPFVNEVKKHLESQEYFGTWINFGKTWDVDEKSFLVAVQRTSSIQSDWNATVEKNAKELPVSPPIISANELSKKQNKKNIKK